MCLTSCALDNPKQAKIPVQFSNFTVGAIIDSQPVRVLWKLLYSCLLCNPILYKYLASMIQLREPSQVTGNIRDLAVIFRQDS